MVVVPNGMLVFLMLLFGTWNTINTKLQFQTCVPTSDAKAAAKSTNCPEGQTAFNKPWQVNQYMFIGEASLLLVHGIQRRSTASSVPLVASGREIETPQKVAFYLFAIPAFCDVFGSGLALVSQTYLDPAVWQMLRSSIIPFSALFSVTFLRRKIQLFRWVGVGIVMVGLVVVAVSSMLDAGSSASTGGSASQQLAGAALTVAATLCTAFQMVFEEKLLTGREVCSAKKVVGGEGVWGGLILMIGLIVMNLVPGHDGGVYENLPDGLNMLGSSPQLLLLAISFTFSIAIYNLTGITVGKRLSSVVRCMVDSCRTVTVWVTSLVLYYCVSENYGAALTPHWWLMLIGFAILTLGTLMYNDILPLPDSWRGVDEFNKNAPMTTTTDSFITGSRVCDLTVEEGN